MSSLSVYADDRPGVACLRLTDPARIAAELARIGVRFERWTSPVTPPRDATEAEVLDAIAPILTS